MMVVKEPQEASEAVNDYPPIQWGVIGMPPLRFALISCVIFTALGGVFSNPLFRWANNAVADTPLLQEAIAIANNQTLG